MGGFQSASNKKVGKDIDIHFIKYLSIDLSLVSYL